MIESHRGGLRFGVYSVETYRRRQNQQYTEELIGHKPQEVFQRIQRDMKRGTSDWGGLIPDKALVDLLESAILKATKEDLLIIDQQFDACDFVVPEHLSKAVEYRAMELKKDEYAAQLVRRTDHYYARSERQKYQEAIEAIQKEQNNLKHQISDPCSPSYPEQAGVGPSPIPLVSSIPKGLVTPKSTNQPQSTAEVPPPTPTAGQNSEEKLSPVAPKVPTQHHEPQKVKPVASGKAQSPQSDPVLASSPDSPGGRAPVKIQAPPINQANEEKASDEMPVVHKESQQDVTQSLASKPVKSEAEKKSEENPPYTPDPEILRLMELQSQGYSWSYYSQSDETQQAQ